MSLKDPSWRETQERLKSSAAAHEVVSTAFAKLRRARHREVRKLDGSFRTTFREDFEDLGQRNFDIITRFYRLKTPAKMVSVVRPGVLYTGHSESLKSKPIYKYHLAFTDDDGNKQWKRLHDVRGTFATKLMTIPGERGADKEIAELMGWSEAQVSEIRRRYVDDAAIVVALGKRLANVTSDAAVKRTVKQQPGD